jgi:hypothetical protein
MVGIEADAVLLPAWRLQLFEFLLDAAGQDLNVFGHQADGYTAIWSVSLPAKYVAQTMVPSGAALARKVPVSRE